MLSASKYSVGVPTMGHQEQSPPPTHRPHRIKKIGVPLFLLMSFVVALSESQSGFLRKLCSLDVYFVHEDEPYGTWAEVYKSSSIDYMARDLTTEVIPSHNINFVVTMLECPELDVHGMKEDSPPNEMFYDMVSMLKFALCQECIDMNINGIQYTTTIQALIPSDAIECMGPNGEPFDRVKIMEELKIGVKIIGSPVGKDSISSECLRADVDNDVGVKDLIKLRAFNMTGHEAVVMVDYTTFVMQDLESTIETFINSNSKVGYAEDYTPHGITPTNSKNGVNTGFLMIKPDEQEFDNIVNMYKTTPYDCAGGSGWANSGVGGFPGAMGTSGILKHYYDQKPASEKTILGKCQYNNNAVYHLDGNGACRDGTTSCENCMATYESEIVIAKLTDEVCGKPFDCPDKGLPDGHMCNKIHKKWFEKRVIYEDTHFKGGRRSSRTGNFRKETTLGFCEGPGRTGYKKIVPDAASGPLPIPEPAAQTEQGCTTVCNAGEYLTQDCTCTSDECDACPEGTRCQRKGNGIPPMCIDCECGFCDYAGNSCCDFNGVNNCKSATNKKECLLQNGYYPGWPGAGNACSGVEISATATPNGCGCQPSESTPCTYTPSTDPNDKCFIVTAHEILTNSIGYVDACKQCLDGCNKCVDGAGQGDVNDMMKCLGKTIGKKSTCRSDCASVCKH